MEPGVDKAGPGCRPWFDHGDHSAAADRSRRFMQEPTNVRHVMEYVGHDDGAQAVGGKWQLACVGDEVHAGAVEHFRADDVRDVLCKEACTRAELKHPSGPRRNSLRQGSIPLVVDLSKK